MLREREKKIVVYVTIEGRGTNWFSDHTRDKDNDRSNIRVFRVLLLQVSTQVINNLHPYDLKVKESLLAGTGVVWEQMPSNMSRVMWSCEEIYSSQVWCECCFLR